MMFSKVIFDQEEVSIGRHRRFVSCIKLVADELIPAVFYLNENWVKVGALQNSGLSVESLTDKDKKDLEARGLLPNLQNAYSMPKLICLAPTVEKGNLGTDQGLPVLAPEREFVLSDRPIINKATLADQGLNPTTAILCLAAAGLDLMLPNIALESSAEDDIEAIRSTLQGERAEYLNVITAMAGEAFERLSSGSTKDVMEWANQEATFKLAPKARAIQYGVASLNRRTLRRAGYSFWKDGTPVIGAAYLGGGLVPAAIASADQVLKTLVSTISGRSDQRALPEVAYAIKISRTLGD